MTGKGALITTRFNSMEAFEEVVKIEYKKGWRPSVQLTHNCNGQKVTSILKTGVSEADFNQTRTGSFWKKVGLCIRSPYFVMQRQNLLRVFILSRRRHHIFGWGDIAFYDIAETMMNHIVEVGLTPNDSLDFSEKGYINTFNHIGSQAFMTTIFSERFADFIADTHERSTLPNLITGEFTEEQLKDVKNGAVDNYVDFINNEWGQELGKYLKKKHQINTQTHWTPQLLTAYLNDMQDYYSRVLEIGFEPFHEADELVLRFSEKINKVMTDLSSIEGIF